MGIGVISAAHVSSTESAASVGYMYDMYGHLAAHGRAYRARDSTWWAAGDVITVRLDTRGSGRVAFRKNSTGIGTLRMLETEAVVYFVVEAKWEGNAVTLTSIDEDEDPQGQHDSVLSARMATLR